MLRRAGLTSALVAIAAISGAQTPTARPRPTPRPTPVVTIATAPFLQPHSAIYDALADKFLVSSTSGALEGADNNGYVSRVSPDGRVSEPKWILGGDGKALLNAPAGLILDGDELIVADMDTVRWFDRRTGASLRAVTIPEARRIEFLAMLPDGRLAVVDTGTEGDGCVLYTVEGIGLAKLVWSSGASERPSGMVAHESGVAIAIGDRLLLLDLAAAAPAPRAIEHPEGPIAGLVRLQDGDLIAACPSRKALACWSAAKGWTDVPVSAMLAGGLALDYTRDRFLILDTETGKATLVPLPPAPTPTHAP